MGLAGREKSGKKRLMSKNKERKTIGANHTVRYGVKVTVRYTEVRSGEKKDDQGQNGGGGNLN